MVKEFFNLKLSIYKRALHALTQYVFIDYTDYCFRLCNSIRFLSTEKPKQSCILKKQSGVVDNLFTNNYNCKTGFNIYTFNTLTTTTGSTPHKNTIYGTGVLNTLRGSIFFNKSKYSRCRQICVNIALLGLYLNIVFVNELHRSFYNININ